MCGCGNMSDEMTRVIPKYFKHKTNGIYAKVIGLHIESDSLLVVINDKSQWITQDKFLSEYDEL